VTIEFESSKDPFIRVKYKCEFCTKEVFKLYRIEINIQSSRSQEQSLTRRADICLDCRDKLLQFLDSTRTSIRFRRES